MASSAESLDKLDVGLLVAVGGKEAEDRITAVEGLGALVETTGKTVLGEGGLQDTTDGSGEVEGCRGSGSGGSLDGSGGGNFNRSSGFSHCVRSGWFWKGAFLKYQVLKNINDI